MVKAGLGITYLNFKALFKGLKRYLLLDKCFDLVEIDTIMHTEATYGDEAETSKAWSSSTFEIRPAKIWEFFCSTAVFVYFFININNNYLKYNHDNNSWFIIEIFEHQV